MTHTSQSREAFESWAQLHYQGGSLNLDRDGEDYRYHLASEWWAAWQAAKAHKAADVVLPEPVAHLVECHAFRASPHGQDAEGYTWLESVEAGSPGAFAVWDEQTVRALLAAAPSVPQGWLPIESAPKDGTAVILTEGGKVFHGAFVTVEFREIRDADGNYVDQVDADEYWMNFDDGDECDPTHWMRKPPLPQPPKEQT